MIGERRKSWNSCGDMHAPFGTVGAGGSFQGSRRTGEPSGGPKLLGREPPRPAPLRLPRPLFMRRATRIARL